MVCGVATWIVAPGVFAVLGRFPALRTVSWVWFALVAACEVLALASRWELTRLALETDRWFDIVCAELAGNGLSRALPGGPAAGGTLEYQMLTGVGFRATQTSSALTATGLMTTGVLFLLPVLALPALLTGLAVSSRLAQAMMLAAVLGAFFFAGGSALVASDRVVHGIGIIADRVMRALGRTRKGRTSIASRLVHSRDQVRDGLATSWTRAVPAAFGNEVFDYLALYASLVAVGVHVHPGLALFAFVVASTLAMIPLTPGGLGFVESGLAGVLALAGVPFDQAVLATLLYRLFSYWLPLPAGAVAALAFRHRHGRLT